MQLSDCSSFAMPTTTCLLSLLIACRPAHRDDQDVATRQTHSPTTGLILQESEGERRVRRPRPSATPNPLGPFIIKVGETNGGSTDFFMGYEDIPPGAGIPPHHHPTSGEILFVHKGTGVASLGSRERAVGPGATIYIPQHTRISLRNTGSRALTIAFFFPGRGIGQYLRETSVVEGDSGAPLSAEEIAAIRTRHKEEITFDSAAGAGAAGLILQEDQGERRFRRPPPTGVTALLSPYIIKVDSKNGRSPDFFMGYSYIPPGDGIAPHHHPYAEEILFIQRGSGVATLGSREAAISAGSTIFIPRNTRESEEHGERTDDYGFPLRPARNRAILPGDLSSRGSAGAAVLARGVAATRARHKEHVAFDKP
jgi:mannose-6-phosphate isomerase-like protein (cupin superfamily)